MIVLVVKHRYLSKKSLYGRDDDGVAKNVDLGHADASRKFHGRYHQELAVPTRARGAHLTLQALPRSTPTRSGITRLGSNSITCTRASRSISSWRSTAHRTVDRWQRDGRPKAPEGARSPFRTLLMMALVAKAKKVDGLQRSAAGWRRSRDDRHSHSAQRLS